jgi:anti-sigma B factor antagonist
MQLSEYEIQEFKIIKIIGDLDASSSIHLDEAFKIILQQKTTAILIDCTLLQYIASAGLGVFISYIDVFEEQNIYFALFGMNEKVKNVFQLLGLEKLLIITNTLEEAQERK